MKTSFKKAMKCFLKSVKGYLSGRGYAWRALAWEDFVRGYVLIPMFTLHRLFVYINRLTGAMMKLFLILLTLMSPIFSISPEIAYKALLLENGLALLAIFPSSANLPFKTYK